MEITGLCFAEGDLQGLCLLADCRAAVHEQFLHETGLQDLFPLHD